MTTAVEWLFFCAFFAVPDCLKRSPHKGKCPSQI